MQQHKKEWLESNESFKHLLAKQMPLTRNLLLDTISSDLSRLSSHIVIRGGVDGVGPSNMSGDLPGKKSQLDLRSFSVGVPVVGCTVMP